MREKCDQPKRNKEFIDTRETENASRKKENE